MVKKSKKKSNKKDQEKEKAQVDDQDESDVEVEDNYNLDHLNRKDKFIIMKIVEQNDELEEEIEKQEQSLQKQEWLYMFVLKYSVSMDLWELGFCTTLFRSSLAL